MEKNSPIKTTRIEKFSKSDVYLVSVQLLGVQKNLVAANIGTITKLIEDNPTATIIISKVENYD